MRTKRYLKNSIYSVVNYILLLLLSLIARKVLISNFAIEYTGYEALFTDIFAILSIADLGMDNIITYKLYNNLANNNKSIVSEIIFIARRIYRYIAIFIISVGAILLFFLPYLFSPEKYDIKLICIVFIIQIVNLFISYLTGYKRLLFIADQREYVCLKNDSMVLIFIQLLRIIILTVFKNYFVYAAMCIIQTIIQNYIINLKCNKEYGEYFNVKLNKIDNLNLVKGDMKNFLYHRISSVIYGATDNIVITNILGLTMVALYSNYFIISKYTYSLLSKITRPMQSSIGNYIYSNKDKHRQYWLLENLNNVAFCLAVFACNGLIQLTTFFVKMWIGNEFILQPTLVITLAVNIYIAINQDFIYYFRNSFGKYDYDKFYMMASAVVNLFFSIVLGKMIGLTGITIGTLIGHLFIWYGRVKFVYEEYFQVGMKKYWIKQMILLFILYIEVCITSKLINSNLNGWKGFFTNGAIVLLITTVFSSFYLLISYFISEKIKK